MAPFRAATPLMFGFPSHHHPSLSLFHRHDYFTNRTKSSILNLPSLIALSSANPHSPRITLLILVSNSAAINPLRWRRQCCPRHHAKYIFRHSLPISPSYTHFGLLSTTSYCTWLTDDLPLFCIYRRSFTYNDSYEAASSAAASRTCFSFLPFSSCVKNSLFSFLPCRHFSLPCSSTPNQAAELSSALILVLRASRLVLILTLAFLLLSFELTSALHLCATEQGTVSLDDTARWEASSRMALTEMAMHGWFCSARC